MSKAKRRNRSILKFIYTVLIILLIAFFSSQAFFRIDLTTEKRYTLSEVTMQNLTELDDLVFIRVYLDGEMPVQFVRMERAIREMLDEYKIYGKRNIEYEFINPYDTEDKNAREDLFAYLVDQGLKPVNIKDKDAEGGETERVIFPGAIVSFQGVEIGINLLKNNPSLPAEVNLNNSVQTLEYKFTSTIHTLTTSEPRKVAFLEGHGEYNQYEVGDITRALSNFYQVDRGKIGGRPGMLDEYAALIVAGPKEKFSEADKFVIDQYLMNGGKVAWFIESSNVSADSLAKGSTLAMYQDLNLNDQLFKYGVRINPELVQDVQCNVLPVNTALQGNQPKFVPAPWLYYPLLTSNSQHPVTTNINPVEGKFVNTVDFVGDQVNRSSSILLSTSNVSRTVNMPKLISLEEIREQPQRTSFNQSYMPVAVMLEGIFPSVFANRPVKDIVEGNPTVTKLSLPTKIAVVADGNIIKNHVRYRADGNHQVMPLGFDRYTKRTFGNKEFVLNLINYMAGQEGIVKLRGRELKMRLLNKDLVKEQKWIWQIVNTILPVILIVLAGILINYRRKRIFGQTQ